MNNEVYQPPVSLLDESNGSSDQAKVFRYFIYTSLLLVANLVMAGLAWFLIVYQEIDEYLFEMLGYVWMVILLMYCVAAGMFVKQLGKRGLLWGIMIVFLQPISVIVSYLMILRLSHKNRWFRNDQG